MPIYEIKCQDGTATKCRKIVDLEIGVVGLTADQIREIDEGETTIEITAAQVEASNMYLDEDDQEFLKDTGFIRYDIVGLTICGPCGTDQD